MKRSYIPGLLVCPSSTMTWFILNKNYYIDFRHYSTRYKISIGVPPLSINLLLKFDIIYV